MRIQTDDGQISQGVRPLHVTTGGKGSGTTQSQQFPYDVLTVSGGGIYFDTYPQSGDWLYVAATGAGSPDNAGIALHTFAASNGICLIDESTVGGGINLNEYGTSQIQIVDFGGTGGVLIAEDGTGNGGVTLAIQNADCTGGIALYDQGSGGISIYTNPGAGGGDGGIFVTNNGSGGITITDEGSSSFLKLNSTHNNVDITSGLANVNITAVAAGIDIACSKVLFLQATGGTSERVIDMRVHTAGNYIAMGDNTPTEQFRLTVQGGATAAVLTISDKSGNTIFEVDNDGSLHGKTGKTLVFDR